MTLANRGMALEGAIQQANAAYLAHGYATVQKIATPTKVLRNRMGTAQVVRSKSTVDFIGVWKGRALAFDAKQSREGRRFSLSKIEPHQMEFLRSWHRDGGIAFLVVELVLAGAWIVPYEDLAVWWERWKQGGRASISRDELERLPKIRPGRGCALDYLTAVAASMQTECAHPVDTG